MAAANESRARGTDELAGTLETAEFVRAYVAPSARGLAAAGILADRLDREATPYHLSVPTGTLPEDVAETTLWIGFHPGDGPGRWLTPATVSAAATTAAASPFASALTGVLSPREAEEAPDELALGLVLDDRPAGLGTTTLVHGPFSGSSSVADDWLSGLTDDEPTTLRSAITLACLDAHGTAGMARALEEFLTAHATPAGPAATDRGTFDLLDVLAATHPGMGLAAACNHRIDQAHVTWRRAAETVHERLSAAALEVKDAGVLRLDVADGPLAPIARLGMILTDAAACLVMDGVTAAAAVTPDRQGQLSEAFQHVLQPMIVHGDGRVSGRLVDDRDAAATALTEVVG